METVYKSALDLAREYVQTPALRREFSILERRLRENFRKENLHGSTEQTRSDRSEILDQLSQILFSELGIDLNDIIDGKTPTRLPTHIQEDQAQLQLAPQRATPIKVFIGCSNDPKDRLYLKRLKSHLGNYTRDERMKLWDETSIRPGEVRQIAIDKALQEAQVAVLLASSDFFDSYDGPQSLMGYQVPELLKRVAQQKVKLLVVLVRPCLIEHTKLGQFGAVNPDKDLSSLDESERERIWMEVIKNILA